MTLDDQVKAIVEALRRRPGLLHGVETALRTQKPVLGPWEKHGMPLQPDGQQRKAVNCNVRATVRPIPGGAGCGWRWDVWDEVGRQQQGEALVLPDAKELCDTWLRENGYLLVEDGPKLLGLWQEIGGSESPVIAERHDLEGVLVMEICEGPEGMYWGRFGPLGLVYPENGTDRFAWFDDCRSACDRELRQQGYAG